MMLKSFVSTDVLLGISLARDQWGNFRKSVPAIEEAVKKMQAKIR